MRRVALSQSTKIQLVYGTIQGFAIAFFLFLFLTYSPWLYQLSEFPYIGPTSSQLTQGQGAELHAIYAESIQLENGSIRAIIKHRSYRDGDWFLDMPISDLVRPMYSDYYFYFDPPPTPTTLACSAFSEKAAGWLEPNGDYYSRVGSAHYVLNDGVFWGQPQQLLQRSNITHFQLAYSLDGILYAAWIEVFDPLDYWESWRLLCWEVNSPTPPQIVSEGPNLDYSDGHLFKLLPGREGRVFIRFKPEDQFYQASHINGTWSVTEWNIPHVVYNNWDAVIDSQETIRFAYSGYGSEDVNQLVCDGQVLSEAYAYRLSLSLDRSDNLQLFWIEYDFLLRGYQYYTQKYMDSSWTHRYLIAGMPTELRYTKLVMMAENSAYLVQEQTVGRAGQLAHYHLGSAYFSYIVNAMVLDASFIDYISTSVPQMLSRFQLFTLWTGSLIIVGVLVFFPLIFLILRSSFIRLISGI
jgi:hypothetical protein